MGGRTGFCGDAFHLESRGLRQAGSPPHWNYGMHAPLLAVDIGNSSTKLGLFGEAVDLALPAPVWTHVLDSLEALAALLPPVAQWRVASVNRAHEQRLADWVREFRPHDEYR